MQVLCLTAAGRRGGGDEADPGPARHPLMACLLRTLAVARENVITNRHLIIDGSQAFSSA